MTQCRELQVFAGVAQAGLQLASGIAALGAASGVLACAGPIGIIGGAVMLLMNLFMKPGPDPTQLILDEIKKLEEKIDNLDKKILSHAIRNEKMQMEILRTCIDGFRLVSQKIDRRFDSLDIKLQSSLEDIKERLKFITAFSENAAIESLSRELVDTNNQVQQYLDGVFGEDLIDGVQACSAKLIKWGNRQCFNPLLTGLAVWNANSNALQIRDYLAEILQKGLANPSLGFIAAYAANQYKADFKAAKVDIAKIANPEIWLQAVQNYVALNAEFLPADIDPQGRAVEQMLAVGEHGLRLAQQIKNDQTLWTNLIKEYQQILQDVKTHANKYASLEGESTLQELNINYRTNPVTMQDTVKNLHFIDSVDTFIQQFKGRSVNKLTGDITTIGALNGVCQEQQFLLAKKTLCEHLPEINATALAAEFCKLLTFSAKQSAELSDYGIKNHVFLKAVERKLTNESTLWALPDGVHGTGGAAYVGEMDSANLTSNEWKLPLQLSYQLSDDGVEKSYASCQVQGNWATFKGGVAAYLDDNHSGRFTLHVINNTVYRTCNYCSPAEIDKFKKQLTEYIRNYWNSNSAEKPLTIPVFNQEFDVATLRTKLNSFFAAHRQKIVYDLCKPGGPDHAEIKAFQDALTKLDTIVMFMRILAHLTGQVQDNPVLKSLLSSEQIVREMISFSEDKTLPAGWLGSIDAALAAKLDQASILDPAYAKNLPSTTQLWEQGLTQLRLYQKWKSLYKSRFPNLSTYVDPQVYAQQCIEARNLLFMHYTMDQFNDLKKKKFVSAKEDIVSINNQPLNDRTQDAFYQKSQRNILAWPMFRSRDTLVTQFNQNLRISELDDIPMGQMSKLYLQPYGWSANIRSLMQYAAQFAGCRFPGIPFVEGVLQFNQDAETDRQFANPANCIMYIEGTRAYLDLIVNNALMDPLAASAGDSDAKRCGNIEDLQKIGSQLKNVMACIATSPTLFDTLFNRYVNIIDEPYQFIKDKLSLIDKPTVDQINNSLGSAPKRKDVFRLLASGVYQGARDKIFDQLSSFAIWIRSYLEMGFGYETKMQGENQLEFQGEKFTLYTSKEGLLSYLQEHNQDDKLDVALENYIQQLKKLKQSILGRVAQANDLNLFRQHLLNRVQQKESALIIDQSVSPLPLTPQKVFLISMFMTSCNVDEITLSNVVIDDESLVGLMQVLLRYPQIKSLSLINASLSPNAYKILQFYLPMFTELSTLNLSRNRCELKNVNHLCDLVEVLPKLQNLCLANCGLDALSVSNISVSLVNHDELNTLDLSGNGCESDESLDDIREELQSNCPQLQELAFDKPIKKFEIAPLPVVPVDITNAVNYRLGQPVVDQLLQELAHNVKALGQPAIMRARMSFFAADSSMRPQGADEEIEETQSLHDSFGQ